VVIVPDDKKSYLGINYPDLVPVLV
jgi:hypothetical protein